MNGRTLISLTVRLLLITIVGTIDAVVLGFVWSMAHTVNNWSAGPCYCVNPPMYYIPEIELSAFAILLTFFTAMFLVREFIEGITSQKRPKSLRQVSLYWMNE